MPVEGGIGVYRGLPLTNPATAPFGHHRQKRGLPPRHRQLQLPSAPIAKCNTHPPRWLPYTTCFGNSTSVSRFVPDSTPPAPQFNTNPHPLTDPSRRPSQRPPLPDPDPNPIPPPPNPPRHHRSSKSPPSTTACDASTEPSRTSDTDGIPTSRCTPARRQVGGLLWMQGRRED